MRLSSLYDCSCESCQKLNLAANSDGPTFKSVLKAAENAFKHLHEKGSYSPEDLKDKPYQKLIDETNKVFNSAVTDNDIPPEMLAKLQNDTFVFSGLRTHAQLLEASTMLMEDGKIRSFDAFANDFNKVNSKYNQNYLEAEWQFAVSSSQSAANWAAIDQDGRYNLQYRTANDSRVRDDHAVLQDTTLPVDDPFWMSYYPPNGWRCRCTAVEVLKEKYTVSDSEKANAAGDRATTKIGPDGKNRSEIFRFNPGMEQKVFPPKHPYNKLKGSEEVKAVVNQNIIEEKLSITKGKEMTFEEANELKGNVNYGKGHGYTINCQSCVVSNELRRRGYDVTALENTKKKDNIPFKLSYKTNWAWLNEKGEMPAKTKVGGYDGTDRRGRTKSKSIVQLSKELNDFTKDVGRYHIDFGWKKSNGGHIITLERIGDGKVRFYDPQNGKIVRWTELSKQISLLHGVNVLRVDNLLLNTDIIDGIVQKLP